MDFVELGIPVGAVLISKDGAAHVTVCAPKLVVYEGTQCSLTAATRKVLGLPEDYALQPSPHWTYNGLTLKEIYEAYHAGLDDV